MRQNLAANQGVASIDMVPFDPENSFQVTDQRLADPGHGNTTLATRLHRRLSQPGRLDAGFLKQVKQIEKRPHINGQPMISNPAVDGHSDRGHTRLTKEHSGRSVLPSRTGQFVEDSDDCMMEPFQVTRKRQTRVLQRHDRIGRKLTREMKRYSPRRG